MASISLAQLIEEITTDAAGEDEQLWAFRQAFEDKIAVPCEASVVGEPVLVVKFDYDGNLLRGLTASCRSPSGAIYIVAACDVAFERDTEGGRYLAAYRKWMGLSPYPRAAAKRTAPKKTVVRAELEMDGTVELVVQSVKDKAVRCRLLAGGEPITLRARSWWELVPGEIVTLRIAKRWTYSGHPYISGNIEAARIDARALGLAPLELEECGMWDPHDHYWGENDEPLEDWAKPIVVWGPRLEYEMEQILPGDDPGDPFSDPIINANDHKNSGDADGAIGSLWICAMPICGVWTPTHTWATWRLISSPKKRSATMR